MSINSTFSFKVHQLPCELPFFFANSKSSLFNTCRYLSEIDTLRGPQMIMSDGTTMVTEVVSEDDSHICLYVLLQDMLKVGDVVVGSKGNGVSKDVLLPVR